uniref:MSP domain-containing protein n=1 Tax=Anopheles epiroticus TaxID=199890 RepID=A0A182PWE9_9DIPT
MSQPAFDSSWMKDKINELSQMEEASFRSGDHMASRLLVDEMAWEQENADIPEMNAKQRQVSPIKGSPSMDLEDSPHHFIQKLKQVQRTKSEQLTHGDDGEMKAAAVLKSHSDLTSGSHALYNAVEKQPRASLRSIGSNKQQMRAPENYQQSDTLSFSESMFDSSSTVPALPHSKTSSPKTSEMSANQSAFQNSNDDHLTPVPEKKGKALVDTFRVSTATKLSEQYMDLPSLPRIRDTPTCQKNIFGDRPIAKPNRKRRSSSATRQELLTAKRDELAAPLNMPPVRSKSPSNRAELKAVSATTNDHQGDSDAYAQRNVSYRPTPKISHQRKPVPPELACGRGTSRKSHLSPEPRIANRSPYSSPKTGSEKASRSSEQYEEIVDKYSLRVPGAPSRSASQCSGSTEWLHRGEGTLPLKATHSELSWGSTKLRKSEKKTMQIKNTSKRKLLVKAVIVGPGFQLCGTEQSGLLTLQSQECRTITVDFCPTVIGPAIGALSFHPPNDLFIQRVVSLYGYGGEASIKIEGIQKGPSGPFLELGSARNLGRPLEKSFSLYNKGTLPAFARIGIDKKGLDQAMLATAVYVQPQRTIIPPNSYAHIKVVFKPRRQQITKILQKQVDVLSITNLHILWGDEPTRHRIRKSITMAKQDNLIDPKLGALESICTKFTEEEELEELNMFSEHVFDTIHELFLTFREYELVLTVDRALDDTMLDLSMADGNTTLFKTMYASSEVGSSPRLPDDMISPVLVGSNGGAQHHEHGTGAPLASSGSAMLGVHRRDSGESWSVRPTMLEFRASTERTKQFVIKSHFYTAQYFELNSNYRQLFRLSPSEGHIRPGQEVVVNVSLQHLQPISGLGNQQPPIFVVVYIENEKISIPVQIHYGN